MTDYLSALKAAQEKAKRLSDALLVDPTNEVLASKYVRAGRDLERALVENTDEILALIEAAKISGELAPRVPDGNKLGHPWMIPNPVLKALAALDAKVAAQTTVRS